MIKVSIEVRSGTASFGVAVQAESIQRAMSLVGASYPGRKGRVKAIEAEQFFVEGPATRTGMVEQPEELAA
jgi:hypothetical protein